MFFREKGVVSLNDGIILAGLRLARLAHDEAEVRLLVVGELNAAGFDGPVNRVLAECLFGAQTDQPDQVVFNHPHKIGGAGRLGLHLAM